MTICDCCEQRVAHHQVTFPDNMVAFVCGDCLPAGDIIHRVDFLTSTLDTELEAMFA